MQLRYNYRVYLMPGQRQALARAFGCARVVFTDALRARQGVHAAGLPYITNAELSARLTAAKAVWAVREALAGHGYQLTEVRILDLLILSAAAAA